VRNTRQVAGTAVQRRLYWRRNFLRGAWCIDNGAKPLPFAVESTRRLRLYVQVWQRGKTGQRTLEIAQVATISGRGTKMIGDIIADAMDKVARTVTIMW